MLLRVGELAKRTGLTVRTLHHYDEIGLVRPSGRSPSGYRLYGDEDIRRLHAVLALRQLGFGLTRIGEILASGDAPVGELIEAQIEAIDRDIAQARALRAQLVVLHQVIGEGSAPQAGPLLQTLNLMDTYQRHFAADELERMFRRWHETHPLSRDLIQAVRAAMQDERAPDDPEVQSLAQRWMDGVMALTDGDLPTALRWSQMHAQAPETARHQGLDPALLSYIGRAIDLRLSALRRHLSDEEILRLDTGLAPRWQGLVARAQALIVRPDAERSPEARELLADWEALARDMAGQDPALHARLLQAYQAEPLLQHGHVVTPQVRAFIERVRHAQAS